MMKNKNILLLGCSGLISTILADKLVNAGAFVDAAGRNAPENSKVNFINWDIFGDNPVLFSLLKPEYDAVVVSAWAGNKPDERENPDINMSCAKALERQVLEVLNHSKVGQIVLTGSQAEYGKACGNVTEEYEINYNTLSAYGKAKLYLYESLKESAGDTVVTELRFHSVYGYFPKKRQMLQSVINKMIEGTDISFYSDGEHHWDYIYVDDAVTALCLAIENCLSGIFNVSSGEQLKFCDYIYYISKIIGNEVNIIYGQKKEPDFIFNSDKLRNKSGWCCKYDFEKGIKTMLSMMLLDKERKYNEL